MTARRSTAVRCLLGGRYPFVRRTGVEVPGEGARLLRLIRAEGATELLTSHVIGKGGPDGFSERLGFVPTGAFDPEGERINRLDIAPRSAV